MPLHTNHSPYPPRASSTGAFLMPFETIRFTDAQLETLTQCAQRAGFDSVPDFIVDLIEYERDRLALRGRLMESFRSKETFLVNDAFFEDLLSYAQSLDQSRGEEGWDQ
ncbi:hypothetical protein ACQ859_29365 [Roseateles chitinivorans]|uniref:hypothetical protein n=1 Tax=Roseateles chitinivorans TaxID=2917965 RepID=UPI003D671B55